jgi:hypothetical protein
MNKNVLNEIASIKKMMGLINDNLPSNKDRNEISGYKLDIITSEDFLNKWKNFTSPTSLDLFAKQILNIEGIPEDKKSDVQLIHSIIMDNVAKITETRSDLMSPQLLRISINNILKNPNFPYYREHLTALLNDATIYNARSKWFNGYLTGKYDSQKNNKV